jgi:hypothetical protein
MTMPSDDTLSLLRLDVQQGVTTALERAAAVWAAHERLRAALQDHSVPHILAGTDGMRTAMAELHAALEVMADDVMMAAAAHVPEAQHPAAPEWAAARVALRQCGDDYTGGSDGTRN